MEKVLPNFKALRKLLFSLLLVAATLNCWADEFYIVGDATPCGWVTGNARKVTQLKETSTSGVYEWTGILKNGGNTAGNGFYVSTELNSWKAIYPSEQYSISDIGESGYQNGVENKWNPVNSDWQYYTITLNTNNGSLSWKAGESFAADGEGYYSISNATDLYWFSVIVNYTNQSAKAKLTNNINYTDYPKGIIGTDSKRFAGTFDGQEHTITLAIDNDATRTGLFGVINGATIKNLVIDGSVKSSAKLLGGLCGVSYGSNTVENVVVKAAIEFTGSGDATCGGLIGDIEAASTIKNCAFYGSFSSQSGTNIRALSSWCSNSPAFVNCIIAPSDIDASGYDNDKLANGSFTTTNCVKIAANDAKLASGEFCYTMNGNQSEISWYQTIGTDALPVPFSSHSQVYANGQLKCDGTSAGGDLVYSNSNTSVIPPHTDANNDGICDVCDNLIPDYLTADAEGFYPIGNAVELNWFRLYVKEVNASAKAKLTTNIDYTEYPQGFIGVGNAFSGTFDGQAHTITLALENDSNIKGLFALINGATIKNLIVDGSVTSGYNNLGGLGGKADGTNYIENVIVKATLTYTPGSGDASCGGFFPYINSGTVNCTDCAFYGSFKLGTANGNGGLVSWNSGTLNVTNCVVAPAEVEAGALVDYARGNTASTTNCYKVDADDARLASGEFCYLLNGNSCCDYVWTQTVGADALPVPFKTQGIVSKITNVGYATLYIPSTDVTVPADVTAYAGYVSGDVLKLVTIDDKIAAGEPVILKGQEGFYSFVPTTGAEKAANNDLTAETKDVMATGNQYCLANGTSGVGFYIVQSGSNIPAGKAYLEIASNVKGFIFAEDGETAIKSLTPALFEGEGVIYNVAGQRINKLQKGINIVNGKKVLK